MTTDASPSACVVIPVYRMPLAKYEQASLERCAAILASHPIVIVKPETLDVSAILQNLPRLTCEVFPDRFFKGIEGYNQLMLSDDFYARFARYEYILIHQLDALVFEDRLHEWCTRGFDYVGAPWISGSSVPTWRKRLRINIRRRYYRWTNRRAPNRAVHFLQYAYSVGNGGFSLRRVAKMREVLATLTTIANAYRSGPVASHHEDMFFCVEANRYRNRVKVPGWREAAHFAWELQPGIAAALTGGRLPFGCHAWDKHRDEWRDIFSKLGLSIDDLLNDPRPTAATAGTSQ